MLDVPANPDHWSGYDALLKGFTRQYGVRVTRVPVRSDAEQVQEGPGVDVFDIAVDTAASHTAQFAPYLVFYWLEIPPALKDRKAYWYESCGGYMAIRGDPPPASLADLSDFGLDGEPIKSNAALDAVVAASLGSGGSADDVAPGVAFFARLAQAGRFGGPDAVFLQFDWNFLMPRSPQLVPSPTVAGYYVQAVNREALHPAAARLWEEYLFSDAGQNACVTYDARPSRFDAMRNDGVLDVKAAAALDPLPAASVMLTAAQMAAARAYVQAHWSADVHCFITC